jgi:phosphatidylglycerophosphate synthase
MRTNQRVKGALYGALRGRRRIVVAAFVALTGFVLGAWLPEERILTGAAVAAVGVATVQLIFYIVDGQNAQAEKSDTSGDRSPE